MPGPINQDEINAILWRACGTFRGTVDPAEYKNYILVMLFVKYVSDVWREHLEQARECYRGDPACGSGSLLIRCAKAVGSRDYALYGQEANGATWALAKMNMFLHDVSSAQIEWDDALKAPTLLEGERLRKYDVVVANPPFSLDKWGAEGAAADR